MSRHALMIGEAGQGIFRPVAGLLQIDEVDRRSGAIERGAAVITVRRTVLDFGGHAANLERRGWDRREVARQARIHVFDARIETGDQFRAAGVCLRIKLLWIPVQSRETLAYTA